MEKNEESVEKWLVKIYRYDGSESVIDSYTDENMAYWHAACLNTATQSTQYRAEKAEGVNHGA